MDSGILRFEKKILVVYTNIYITSYRNIIVIWHTAWKKSNSHPHWQQGLQCHIVLSETIHVKEERVMKKYLNFQQVIGTTTSIWRSDSSHYYPFPPLYDYWLEAKEKQEICVVPSLMVELTYVNSFALSKQLLRYPIVSKMSIQF